MAKFFIDRPVFAWVIAIFIVLAGLMAMRTLPVAQYPSIAPPTVFVRATFPGASALTVAESVTSVLEQELNGVEGLLYIESSSEASGASEITLAFASGTDPDFATVNVQNRVKRAEPRLPKAVLDQGIMVLKTGSDMLLFVSLTSTDGKLDSLALADYMSRAVLNELRRIPGVGEARLFGSETAMRIWVDPNKLAAKRLTASDLASAVRSQNTQVAGGRLGDEPSPATQRLTSAVVVRSQLATPAQ
ncbi:MAG: efflux RND transporter permease subunit, partial [Janthinobacterium lividum]